MAVQTPEKSMCAFLCHAAFSWWFLESGGPDNQPLPLEGNMYYSIPFVAGFVVVIISCDIM